MVWLLKLVSFKLKAFVILVSQKEYGLPNQSSSEGVILNESAEVNHSLGLPDQSVRSQHSILSQALEHAGDWTAVDAPSTSHPQTPNVTSKVKKQLTFQDDDPPEVMEGEHFAHDADNWEENSM